MRRRQASAAGTAAAADVTRNTFNLSSMNSTSRLWRWLGLIFVLSFGALGFIGYQIYRISLHPSVDNAPR